LNTPFFIASKLVKSKEKSFTKTIIRIAIVAVALSIAVMILTNGMITGFKTEIHNKIFGFWGHIHIANSAVTRNYELIPIKNDKSINNAIKNIQPLTSIEVDDNIFQKTKGGVESVQPFIIMPGLLEKGRDFQTVMFKGVDNDFQWSKIQRFILPPAKPITRIEENEILVSKSLADRLNIKQDQNVIVSFIKEKSKIGRKLKVRAIYNTGLEEYDRRYIIGHMDKLRPLLSWQKDDVLGFEVFVENIDDIKPISDFIYSEILPNDLYSETIQQKYPSIFEWLKLQDINEKVILQLMAIVAIINMMTVILILILERTRMIGILKAIGADNWLIQKVFLYNAATIIFYGVILGNIIGLGLAFIQIKFKLLKLDEASYYLDTAPVHISWASIAMINIAAFALILFFLILPTFFINRIKPIQVLRFD
jgi:lipoprotein-releasing system permease protein